jgi:hypothetical protein
MRALSRLFTAIQSAEWSVRNGYSVDDVRAEEICAAYRDVSNGVNGIVEPSAVKWSFELLLDLEERVMSVSDHADTKRLKRDLESALKEAKCVLASAIVRWVHEIAPGTEKPSLEESVERSEDVAAMEAF